MEVFCVINISCCEAPCQWRPLSYPGLGSACSVLDGSTWGIQWNVPDFPVSIALFDCLYPLEVLINLDAGDIFGLGEPD